MALRYKAVLTGLTFESYELLADVVTFVHEMGRALAGLRVWLYFTLLSSFALLPLILSGRSKQLAKVVKP